MKKIFIRSFIIFMLINICVYADLNVHESRVMIIFKVNNNLQQKKFLAELEINNLPQRQKENSWQLAFNLMRTIKVVSSNANLVEDKSVGDFHVLKFRLPESAKTVKCSIDGQGVIQTYTDAPQGYFLIELNQEKEQVKETIYSVKKVRTELLNSTKFKPITREDNEGRADDSRIMPLPVEITHKTDQQDFVISFNTPIIIENHSNKLLQTVAKRFQSTLQEATAYSLPIQANGKSSLPHILLTTKMALNLLDKKQREEGYVIDATPTQILVSATTEPGFFYALQSLKQLLPPEVYATKKITSKVNWRVPNVHIVDYPRFDYRGLHLDVARHFFPPSEVKRLLDLMAMHKLNYFHWHLTDDEGWRLEIKKFPQLTKIGGYRGYQLGQKVSNYLPPAFGSGPQPYGGYYTQEEIHDIVSYASNRFITIVPEIDFPGHARAMIISLRDQLGETNHGEYKSVQGYSDNVLPVCNLNTYNVIESIIQEVAELFPGKYIHIGGDEVPDGVWQNSLACKNLKFDATDPHFKSQVQNYFLQRLQKIIAKHGKIMVGWEEVAANKINLSPPLLVYVWNNDKLDQVYKKSAQAQYKIIMAPAKNLYFDLAYQARPDEPGQHWAGYVDTFSAYSLKLLAEKKSNPIIKGVQAQLWSEEITSPERMDYFAFPRLAGLAELAWTLENRRDWKSFYERMKKFHLKRLDNYGVHYRRAEFQ